jgi:hypothetical protein
MTPLSLPIFGQQENSKELVPVAKSSPHNAVHGNITQMQNVPGPLLTHVGQ